MNNIPGLKIDVGFGSVNEKLPDWRKAKELGDSEQDPDDDQIETPEDVKAMLGFDPAEESKEDDMEQNRVKETLAFRLARNRCGARSRARLEPGAVENAGTSEGVRKSWLKRERSHDYGFDPLGNGKWRAVPSGDIVDKAEMERRKSMRSQREAPRNEIFGMSWDELERKQGGKLTRNSTMLEQASPSPMIGEYAEGKARRSVLADKLAAKNTAFNAEQLAVGTKHEMEHTTDPKVARKIAADHLGEDPDYYRKLKKCMGD